MNLNDKIQAIYKSFVKDKKNFKLGLIEFNDLKNKYLSRKGLLSELYPLLNNVDVLNRPDFGRYLINRILKLSI